MTIADIEKSFIEGLRHLYDTQEAMAIARLCINSSLGISLSHYYELKHKEMQSGQAAELLQILGELKKGIPVQYVLGETWFYGLVFKVNRSVLIPRPETEELVDLIIKDVKKSFDNQHLKILDIGTGSACIPVALKKNLPFAELFAMDVSSEALRVARENARINSTEISFIEDDILNPVTPPVVYSIIVSNPPYVTWNERGGVHSNVLDYEPHLALFVPDNDPLIFYKAIADYSIRHLAPGGHLYLEINENLGTETVKLLKNRGFSDIELKQDLRGKDRMIRAKKG